MGGFEWATMLVLWLACAVPVLSMLLVAVGAGLLGWKLVARMEVQSRDLMKCLMAMSQNTSGQQLAAQMEMTDGRRDELQNQVAEERQRRRAQ